MDIIGLQLKSTSTAEKRRWEARSKKASNAARGHQLSDVEADTGRAEANTREAGADNMRAEANTREARADNRRAEANTGRAEAELEAEAGLRGTRGGQFMLSRQLNPYIEVTEDA